MTDRAFYSQLKLDPNNPQDRAVIDAYYDHYAPIGITRSQYSYMKMVPDAPASIALENEVKARTPATTLPGAYQKREDI